MKDFDLLLKLIDFTKLPSAESKFLRAVPSLIALHEWDGLMPWDAIDNRVVDLWKQTSIKDLKGLLTKEIYYASQTLYFLTEQEKLDSADAIANKTTLYTLEDVVYDINDYGFRGDFDLGDTDTSVAFFGCSLTFGVGVPEADCFPTLIGKALNATPYNFGVPGSSFNRSARYFELMSQHKKFDYAIFLLPEISRLEFPKINETDLVVQDVGPNIGTDESYLRKIYSVLSDEYLEYNTLKTVLLCTKIARENNTKIYFSSWSPSTYNLLYNFLGKDSEMLIPYFENLGGKYENTAEFSRDGRHPGASSHLQFCNKSIDYIK